MAEDRRSKVEMLLWGSNRRRFVLLIEGACGRGWDPVAELLNADGHTVMVVSLLGFSPRQSAEIRQLGDWVDSVYRHIQSMNIDYDECVVAGHSLGTLIAIGLEQRLATQGKLRAVVCSCPPLYLQGSQMVRLHEEAMRAIGEQQVAKYP